MIKIDDVYPTLDYLAKRYYFFLNKKKKDRNYRVGALINIIRQARATDVLNNNNELVDFWDYFLNNNYANLKRVIIGRPSVLEQIILEIEFQFPALSFSRLTPQNQLASSATGIKVLEVFDYTNLYRAKQYCHDTYAKLKISSCPYCNEGVAKVDLFQGRVNLREMLNHQLDHFFSQVRYPYLSLSFFNLIPSCYHCNSVLKGTTNLHTNTHINPYDNSVDDNFEFFIEDILPDNETDVKVDFRQKTMFPTSALNDFNIKWRYNHPTIKKEIYKSYSTLKFHSNKVIKSISEQYGINIPLENDFNQNIRRQLFHAPLNANEILFTQYAKLKRDIFHFLELNN